MIYKTNMRSTRSNHFAKLMYALVLALACLLASSALRHTSAATINMPKTFSTPEAAANALIDAAENFDVPVLEQIFGPGGQDIIHTGEPARDREIAKQFAEQARTKMSVSVDTATKRRATILVGADGWPFPVPLVKLGSTWSFDSKEGLHEILIRRIGRNELDAIEICRGFVEAQKSQSMETRSSINTLEIISSGKQDGVANLTAWDGQLEMRRVPLSAVTPVEPITATSSRY
jgi:hypothetical protein